MISAFWASILSTENTSQVVVRIQMMADRVGLPEVVAPPQQPCCCVDRSQEVARRWPGAPSRRGRGHCHALAPGEEQLAVLGGGGRKKGVARA